GYLRTHGVWAARLTASYLAGPYRWPSYRCGVSCVMTNKTPSRTVRAPGSYEGPFARERVVDLLAARLGLDPAEMRRRNLHRPSDAPYTVSTVAAAVTGREADFTGEDFPEMFEQALKAGQYEARVAACRERNAAGGDVRFGVGLAAGVETSGSGPFQGARGAPARGGVCEVGRGAGGRRGDVRDRPVRERAGDPDPRGNDRSRHGSDRARPGTSDHPRSSLRRGAAGAAGGHRRAPGRHALDAAGHRQPRQA